MADVVLPAAVAGEKAGSTTNLEGRVTTVSQQVTPAGTARADWMVAAELADALGRDPLADTLLSSSRSPTRSPPRCRRTPEPPGPRWTGTATA